MRFKSKQFRRRHLLWIISWFLVLSVFIGLRSTVAAAESQDVAKSNEKIKVIFDTDNGEFGDDTKALLMLLNSDRFDLLGITTMTGNYWLEVCTAYTLRQLELWQRTDIPVYMGMGEPLLGDMSQYMDAGLLLGIQGGNIGYLKSERPSSYMDLEEEPVYGYPESKAPEEMHAVDFMAEAVRKNRGEVTIVCVGAPTNVAMFAKRYPELVSEVKRVVYMGGAIDERGNTTAAAEFNWWADPLAAKICMTTAFPEQVLVPKDICMKARITYDTYEKIRDAEPSTGRNMFMEYNGPRHEADREYKNTLFDEVTILYLLDESFVTKAEDRIIDVDMNLGANFGRSIGYRTEPRHPELFHTLPNCQTVNVLLDMDVDRFMDLYVHYLTLPMPKKS
ncbi:MAG: nucleoside hydrolase [Eubacteriales bacterium]|nr:nucleoside hydrolase [Eubacteriales bacterium]